MRKNTEPHNHKTMGETKVDFLTVLHLAELYHEQYGERGLCLSPEQNETSFRDFVTQYYSAQYWGTGATPVINTDVPLF